jgi:aminopeptidase N
MDMAGSASARAVQAHRRRAQPARSQFPEDAGPMAHPVRPDSYSEINNFYTATVYEKGAEVVRMMHTLVGREPASARHGPVLPAPRRPGRDLRRLRPGHRRCQPRQRAGQPPGRFKRWYAQAGTPRAAGPRPATTPPPARYTLTLRQQRRAVARPAAEAALRDAGALGLLAADDGHALPLQLEGEAAAAAPSGCWC